MIIGKNTIDYSKTDDASKLRLEVIKDTFPNTDDKPRIYEIQVSNQVLQDVVKNLKLSTNVAVKGKIDFASTGQYVLVAERIMIV
jgi:hypothetical protein